MLRLVGPLVRARGPPPSHLILSKQHGRLLSLSPSHNPDIPSFACDESLPDARRSHSCRGGVESGPTLQVAAREQNIEHDVDINMSNPTTTTASSAESEPDVLWPSKIFTHPRQFDLTTENLTYFELLKAIEFDNESGTDSEDDCDEEDDRRIDTTTGGLDNHGPILEADDSPEHGSAVRQLGIGVDGKNAHRHPNEKDEIADFVEHRVAQLPQAREGVNPTLVALIDDQIDATYNAPQKPGKDREVRYRGGVSSDQLRETLRKPVRALSFFPASNSKVLIAGTRDS